MQQHEERVRTACVYCTKTSGSCAVSPGQCCSKCLHLPQLRPAEVLALMKELKYHAYVEGSGSCACGKPRLGFDSYDEHLIHIGFMLGRDVEPVQEIIHEEAAS